MPGGLHARLCHAIVVVIDIIFVVVAVTLYYFQCFLVVHWVLRKESIRYILIDKMVVLLSVFSEMLVICI